MISRIKHLFRRPRNHLLHQSLPNLHYLHIQSHHPHQPQIHPKSMEHPLHLVSILQENSLFLQKFDQFWNFFVVQFVSQVEGLLDVLKR